ncbi:5046_t:CDS:2, partial [Dentiscutata erythropus]
LGRFIVPGAGPFGLLWERNAFYENPMYGGLGGCGATYVIQLR